MGLTGVLSGSEELAALTHRLDLAVDATGVPAVAGALVGYVANGGAASFFGVCPQDARIEISPFELFRRELTLFGTHSLNHNIPQALDVLRAIGPSVAGVVTHGLSPEEVADVMAGHEPAGSLKIQMVGSGPRRLATTDRQAPSPGPGRGRGRAPGLTPARSPAKTDRTGGCGRIITTFAQENAPGIETRVEEGP